MNTSQKKNTRGEQINLVDPFFYLLSHWYWFLICIVLAVSYAWYRYSKSPLLYRSDVTVIIKDPSNTTRSVRMDNYSNTINAITMSNEMLQLRSKTMMTEVVRSLDADIEYKRHVRLRDIELYRNAPIRLFVSREDGEEPGSFSAKVTPLDARTLQLNLGGATQKVALGDTIALAGGRAVFLLF